MKVISTEGLLQTCLQFPYLTDILFYENYQKGFEALTTEFNGFQELLIRENLINALLIEYNRLTTEVTNLRFQNSVEKGRFSFRHFILELLFTQNVVFENLSLEQEKELILLTFKYEQIKKDYPNIFGRLNELPTKMLYAKKIMNDPMFRFYNAEEKKEISDFIQAPLTINHEVTDRITEYIKSIYK